MYAASFNGLSPQADSPEARDCHGHNLVEFGSGCYVPHFLDTAGQALIPTSCRAVLK